MIFLGLNAFGHDAATVLLVDGRVVYAASEERLDRRRHSAAFPARGIEAALAHAGLALQDVDGIACPWTRAMAMPQKIVHVLRHLPRSRAFLRRAPADPEGDLPSRPAYLAAMAGFEGRLRALGYRGPVHRVAHHRAHAASARSVLPEGRGSILTADGMGEWTTAAAWQARGTTLSCHARASYPHSPGKAYSAVTQWLGFRPESDEGKTMGLAAYGAAEHPAARFTRALIRPHAGGLLRVRLDAFGYPWGESRLWGPAFLEHLGPPRGPGEALRPADAPAARGIQDAVEHVMGRSARDLLARARAPDRTLGVAGGLFLNCALNGHLLRTLGVPVLPFPVAGDAGAAFGAAVLAHARQGGRPPLPLRTLRLGHDLTPAEARAALPPEARPTRQAARAVADRIRAGRLVGVARGRAEFGPRALGGRSILASPTSTALRDRLNRHKGREAWRPLAPIVREGDRTYFRDLVPSPWMILTFEATPEARRRIPGAVHVDGTARVQTVTRDGEPFLWAVLDHLERAGEPPVVLNTSFNRRGEPIVDTAAQAWAAARAMELDSVLIADRLVDLAP